LSRAQSCRPGRAAAFLSHQRRRPVALLVPVEDGRAPIAINGGAAFTNSASVTLTLSATSANAPVTQMQFSKDRVNYFPFEPFATSRTVTLAVGPNTLTVRFKDSEGNVSDPISASITRN